MITCIQHVPFETPGYVLDYAKAKQKKVAIVTVYQDHRYPDVNDIELLIIMGGPMSVHDENEYPWLVEEKDYIEKVLNAGKPVLGICLGAQLIADVLGAKVYKNHSKEIGWYHVTTIPQENAFARLLPQTFMAFHWHGETFDIPVGAVHIAQTPVCKHQAFAVDNKILALQFHLEITPQGVYDLATNCSDELHDNGYIQSEGEIIGGVSNCGAAHLIMHPLLEVLTMSYRQP